MTAVHERPTAGLATATPVKRLRILAVSMGVPAVPSREQCAVWESAPFPCLSAVSRSSVVSALARASPPTDGPSWFHAAIRWEERA